MRSIEDLGRQIRETKEHKGDKEREKVSLNEDTVTVRR